MEDNREGHELSLFQQIQQMSVAEKLDLAHKAPKEARSILMRDSNKMVQLAVISSPKITDSEVVMIANNRQVNEEVLRTIAKNREWMKKYQIKLALTTNPKTPLAISLKQIPFLVQRDIASLARSKSIPRPVAQAAQRRLREHNK